MHKGQERKTLNRWFFSYRNNNNLHKFFEEINSIHPRIKFTMSHTTPKAEQERSPSCPVNQQNQFPILTLHVKSNKEKLWQTYRESQQIKTNICLILAVILLNISIQSPFLYQWESIIFAVKKRQEQNISQRWKRCLLTESIQEELLTVPSQRPGLFPGKRNSDKCLGNTPQSEILSWYPTVPGCRQFQTSPESIGGQWILRTII